VLFERRTHKILFGLALLFFFLGVVVAAAIMFIALDHNPMGEFCLKLESNTCETDWAHLSLYGLIYYGVIAGVPAVVLTLLFVILGEKGGRQWRRVKLGSAFLVLVLGLPVLLVAGMHHLPYVS
jgi:hypothetical protein